MVSFVLHTHHLTETHARVNVAQVLKSAVTEWELERANHGIAVITDNARNVDVAVRGRASTTHQVFCPHVKLGHPTGFERIPHQSFAGSSETSCSLLPPKLQSHQCIHILTETVGASIAQANHRCRHTMEQQSGYDRTLSATESSCCSSSPKHRRLTKCHEINTLDGSDISDAEDKTKTTVSHCALKAYENSMAFNKHSQHEKSYTQQPFRQIHWGIRLPAGVHCIGPQFLNSASSRRRSAPRMCSTGWRRKLCSCNTIRLISLWRKKIWGQQVPVASYLKQNSLLTRRHLYGAELEQPPPSKKALEDLLGGTFVEPAAAQSISGIEAEMDKYRSETSVSLTNCPLNWPPVSQVKVFF
ncbi:uncharacterized protein LOC121905210 [Thunnus maccoyii]|uniref:uncharacterized protein LOC121905210 n=1 Tax=Thunnus maccoyii TaxID=8240 RepID=UPI001C4A8E78|nr:uncharacterized protein LOC121905210 [Thunnus maccoyii]